MKQTITYFGLLFFSILSAILIFFGNLIQIFIDFFRWGDKKRKLDFYLLNSALAIDIMGNTLYKPILNSMFTRKNSYSFGTDISETISSGIGKNQCIKGLTWLGIGLGSILDLIDSGHCYDAINDKTYHEIYARPEKVKLWKTIISLIIFIIMLFLLYKLLIFII